MRGLGSNSTLRLQAIVSIQRCQGSHKTLDVVARAGVYNIEIEGAKGSAFEDRCDAAYDDEIDSVLIQSAYDGEEISCRHSGRGSLRPN